MGDDRSDVQLFSMPDVERPNHPPTYRAYRVSPGRRVSTAAVILQASNDEEVIAAARKLVDEVGIEVWDRARRVIALPPKGGGDPR